jgi:LysM repeat protein
MAPGRLVVASAQAWQTLRCAASDCKDGECAAEEKPHRTQFSQQVRLAISHESMENPEMSFRVRLLYAVATVSVATLTSSIVHAQDALVGELKALRQIVEQQSKQLETLTAQIARLNARIEGTTEATQPAAERTAPAAPDTADFAIPAARPVAPHPPANVHIVVKGESLERIAKSHGTTVLELQKINHITDPKKLQIGQQLLLPPPNPKKEGQ